MWNSALDHASIFKLSRATYSQSERREEEFDKCWKGAGRGGIRKKTEEKEQKGNMREFDSVCFTLFHQLFIIRRISGKLCPCLGELVECMVVRRNWKRWLCGRRKTAKNTS